MQLEPKTLPGSICYRRPVGLLGGSFSPPHLGHVHVSEVALRMFDLGQIYWVYTKQNPLKKATPLNFAERVAKTKKLIRSPKIKLSSIELKNNFYYSYQVLKFLQQRNRHIKFIWVMGEDNIIQFHLWKNWQWVASNVRIAVVARGRNRSLVNSSTFAQKYRAFRLKSSKSVQLQFFKPPIWCIVDSRKVNLSSTDIRFND